MNIIEKSISYEILKLCLNICVEINPPKQLENHKLYYLWTITGGLRCALAAPTELLFNK